MKANSQMLTLLAKYVVEDVVNNLPLAPQLQSLVVAPLREYEGGVFLEPLFNKAAIGAKTHSYDLTGWECFVNHVHIDDYIGAHQESDEEPIDVLLQGLKFAVELIKKLKKYKPEEVVFRIIVSYSDYACTVRFHEIRENESWLSDSLENYSEEALYVFETDKSDQ